MTMARAQTAPRGPVGLLVPAYFYPSGSGLADWNRLAAAATQVPLMAILNPNNGPGRRADSNYLSVNLSLKAAGGQTLGYVYTKWGRRSLSAVQADVSRYFSWYAIDGIFIDEMAATATPQALAYYQSLAAYIRSLNPQARIVANPGCAFAEAFAQARVADVFVDQENPVATVNQTAQSSWVGRYPASMFAEIALGCADNAHEVTLLAANRWLGWVYATHLSGDAAFDALPPDFSAEVAALVTVNATR